MCVCVWGGGGGGVGQIELMTIICYLPKQCLLTIITAYTSGPVNYSIMQLSVGLTPYTCVYLACCC